MNPNPYSERAQLSGSTKVKVSALRSISLVASICLTVIAAIQSAAIFRVPEPPGEVIVKIKLLALGAVMCLAMFAATSSDKSKGRWVRVAILPFIAYVLVALPLALMIPAVDIFHHNNRNISEVLPGYRISIYVLLVGGSALAVYGRKLESVVTFVVAMVCYMVLTHRWFHF